MSDPQPRFLKRCLRCRQDFTDRGEFRKHMRECRKAKGAISHESKKTKLPIAPKSELDPEPEPETVPPKPYPEGNPNETWTKHQLELWGRDNLKDADGNPLELDRRRSKKNLLKDIADAVK